MWLLCGYCSSVNICDKSSLIWQQNSSVRTGSRASWHTAERNSNMRVRKLAFHVLAFAESSIFKTIPHVLEFRPWSNGFKFNILYAESLFGGLGYVGKCLAERVFAISCSLCKRDKRTNCLPKKTWPCRYQSAKVESVCQSLKKWLRDKWQVLYLIKAGEIVSIFSWNYTQLRK